LHEIVHAISDTLGGGLTEEQVRCIEQGIAMIIQDNPVVFEEIARDLIYRERGAGKGEELPM
jgi:phosphoribosylaminoimidazole (AIR) synthetase